MGLLDRIKENRKEYKTNKEENRLQRSVAQQKAQAAYDIEFQKGAVEAVKKRARRDAMNRYGYNKGERRARVINNFTKELGELGDWGVGNTPSQKRSHSHTHGHKKKSRSRAHPQRSHKQEDPFDIGDLDDFNL
jgi:hypothetical protein